MRPTTSSFSNLQSKVKRCVSLFAFLYTHTLSAPFIKCFIGRFLSHSVDILLLFESLLFNWIVYDLQDPPTPIPEDTVMAALRVLVGNESNTQHGLLDVYNPFLTCFFMSLRVNCVLFSM